jgi:hypothetical protein
MRDLSVYGIVKFINILIRLLEFQIGRIQLSKIYLTYHGGIDITHIFLNPSADVESVIQN